MNNTYKCPLGDYDCPYYDEDGFCRLGEDAIEECADAADFESLFGEDEEDLRYIADWDDEEDLHYIADWEDEEETDNDDFIMFEADEFFRILAEMPEDF